jgi:hypothetical protein
MEVISGISVKKRFNNIFLRNHLKKISKCRVVLSNKLGSTMAILKQDWGNVYCFKYIKVPADSFVIFKRNNNDNTTSRSWGRSVSIVSDYRLDDRASITGRDEGFFPLASVSRPAPKPTQPPIQWGPFPGANAQQGCDADHPRPSNAEVKNE